MRLFLFSALFSSTEFARATNEVGLAFLEENKKREGVITLKSGLQYKVLTKGEGKVSPKKDTSCECHYVGTTVSLTENPQDKPEAEWNEFDSSYKRGEPTSFAPNQVIKGWTEAMQLMVEGDKWEMYIPSDLGYGDSGTGDKIKGGDMLVFRMELLKIKGKDVVRRVVCEYASEDLKGCDEGEKKAFNEWKELSWAKVEEEWAKIQAKGKETLKKPERLVMDKRIAEMKPVYKARKKMEKKEKKKAEL